MVRGMETLLYSRVYFWISSLSLTEMTLEGPLNINHESSAPLFNGVKCVLAELYLEYIYIVGAQLGMKPLLKQMDQMRYFILG